MLAYVPMKSHLHIDDSNNLKILLLRMGLNLREVVIYEYIFESGPQATSVIAKNVHMKRTTVYCNLVRMANQGLIHSYKKNAINYFDISPYEEAVAKLDREVEGIMLKKQILMEVAMIAEGRKIHKGA